MTYLRSLLLLLPVWPCLYAQLSNGAGTTLSLEQAIDLALQQNHLVRIGQDKIREMQSTKHLASSDYWPKLWNASAYTHLTQRNLLEFSPGSLGVFPGVGALPVAELDVRQGQLNQIVSQTQIAQPLTQLIKVRQANKAAQADLDSSHEMLTQTQNEVALLVRQLYFSVLVAQANQQAAAAQTMALRQQLEEAEQDVKKGNALRLVSYEAKASLLQSQQQELEAKIEDSDSLAELKSVIGLSPEITFTLETKPERHVQTLDKQQYISLAQSVTPEIRTAENAVKKAASGESVAKAEYIPDLTAFARHDYQNGVPFLLHNYDVFGVSFKYDLFDGGKRRAAIQKLRAERSAAEENLKRLKDEVIVRVEKVLDKLEQTRHLIEVAEEALRVSEESDRLTQVQVRLNAIVRSKQLQAVAALSKAKASLLEAEAAYSLSDAQLNVLIGRLPR